MTEQMGENKNAKCKHSKTLGIIQEIMTTYNNEQGQKTIRIKTKTVKRSNENKEKHL